MAFDPKNAGDISRLKAAINWSERRLRPFRLEKMDALRLYCGFHYGEFATTDKQPIPLIELGVNIYQRQLASTRPRASVSPKYKRLTPGAADLELATNHVIDKMELGHTFNEAVTQSMFSFGVIKVGIASEGSGASAGGYLHETGQAFADAVLDEDFFWDMRARKWEQCSYVGNRFRVPLEWAKENKEYNKRARENLSPLMVGEYDGDRGGMAIRSETISQGQGPLVDEYRDTVEMMEIWLPEEQLVITVADAATNLEVLRTVEWEGPRHGPYHILSFNDVVGNLMPLPPVALWRDLHELTNRLMNKVTRQAERQKTWTAVDGRSKDDGNRVVEVNDGEAIFIENLEGIKEVNHGGANKDTLAMVIWAKDMLSYIGGNWDALGGLSVQSRTVGQDRLLDSNANGRVQDMQNRFMEFARGIMRDIGWYVFHDPVANIPIHKPIRGTNFTVATRFTPEKRQGDYFDYYFDVDPYSLQSESPQDKMAKVTQFVQQTLIPLAPMLSQNGISINWELFIKMFAKAMQVDELLDLMNFGAGQQEPEQQPPGMGGPTPGQQQAGGQQADAGAPPPSPTALPQQTTRNYVRHNVSSATRQGKDQVLMSHLLGASSQPSEMAGMMGR